MRVLRRLRRGATGVGTGWVAFALCVVPNLGAGTPPCPASFGDFLEQFETDRSFQVENTAYPLKHSTVDVDARPGPRVVEKELSRLEVEAGGGGLYPSSAEQKRAGLVPEVEEVDSTRVIVRLRKPDTGYLLIYDFRRVQGCWKLIRFEDAST